MLGEFYLAFAIIFTAVSQILYKSFFTTRYWSGLIIAVMLFILTPIMAYMALKTLSLGTVYMATGLTYVLIVILAKYLLGETISRRKLQGIILIVSGVIIFNY